MASNSAGSCGHNAFEHTHYAHYVYLYFWRNFGASPRRFPKFICHFAPFSIEFDPSWTLSSVRVMNRTFQARLLLVGDGEKEDKKLKTSKEE